MDFTVELDKQPLLTVVVVALLIGPLVALLPLMWFERVGDLKFGATVQDSADAITAFVGRRQSAVGKIFALGIVALALPIVLLIVYFTMMLVVLLPLLLFGALVLIGGAIAGEIFGEFSVPDAVVLALLGAGYIVGVLMMPFQLEEFL